MRRSHAAYIALISCSYSLIALPVQAATFQALKVSFNESVFPKQSAPLLGKFAYNLIDDRTGQEFSKTNPVSQDDRADFSLDFLSLGPESLTGTSSLQFDNGKITSLRGFEGKVDSNNPGTLVTTTTTLRFADHVTVQDLSARFTSFNSLGTAWEYGLIGFLDKAGLPFSPRPTITPYGNTGGNTGSYTGSPTQGWYVVADQGTVKGVGSDRSQRGIDSTLQPRVFTKALVGLDQDQQIGGLIWSVSLQDTRGVNNMAQVTSAADWLEFTVSGDIASPPKEIATDIVIPTDKDMPTSKSVPEGASGLAIGLATLIIFGLKRRI